MEVSALSKKSSRARLEEFGDRPNGQFVGVLVQYRCVTGSCDYNPYDFTLRSEDGEEFDRSVLSSFKPDLDSGTLRAGAKAKGYVTYELKGGKYDLEYRTNTFSDDVAVWPISVP